MVVIVAVRYLHTLFLHGALNTYWTISQKRTIRFTLVFPDYHRHAKRMLVFFNGSTPGLWYCDVCKPSNRCSLEADVLQTCTAGYQAKVVSTLVTLQTSEMVPIYIQDRLPLCPCVSRPATLTSGVPFTDDAHALPSPQFGQVLTTGRPCIAVSTGRMIIDNTLQTLDHHGSGKTWNKKNK